MITGKSIPSVSASRPAEGNEIDLHFVNYNREPGRRAIGAGESLTRSRSRSKASRWISSSPRGTGP